MLKRLPAVIGCIGLIASFSTLAEPKLDNLKNKASYSIGINLGSQLSRTKDDIDLDSVILGVQDAFAGEKPRLTIEEIQQVMQEFQAQMQQKQMEKMAAISKQNKEEGKAYLAKNKTKKGVKTLESGLQYRVIKAGKGESPKASDTVVTHYRGNLINGQVFDSSYKRGEPATFPVNGVIPGWTEALQKMKVGGKWELVIPAELAYGSQGAGQIIGPDSVLIFEIELLEIKKG